MRKPDASKTIPATPLANMTDEHEKTGMQQAFLLLKTDTAKKIGKQSEGGISYQILGDTERQHLSIAITGNDSGGYFSREIVPFHQVEACLAKHKQDKPFPSKLFKDAFIGRSSNNAGFLAAILRAEGLLVAAPEAETQHIVSGDWATWKKSLLAEPGQMIEIGKTDKQQGDSDSAPAHTEQPETRKTLTVKRAKPDAQISAPDEQDT